MYRTVQPAQRQLRPRRRNMTLEAIERTPELLDRSRALPPDFQDNLEQTVNNLAALWLASHDGNFADRIERGR